MTRKRMKHHQRRNRNEGLRYCRKPRAVQRDHRGREGSVPQALQTPGIGDFLVAVERAESDASQKHHKMGLKSKQRMNRKVTSTNFLRKLIL